MGLYVKVLGEHISSLDKKLDDLIVLIKQIYNNNISKIIGTSETASLSKIAAASIQRPPDIQDFQIKMYSDLEEILDKKFSNLTIKPIDLSHQFADNIASTSNINKVRYETLSELNKLHGSVNHPHFADNPRMRTHYYPRPTPQDVLIEERDWNQTNTSYSGNEINE